MRSFSSPDSDLASASPWQKETGAVPPAGTIASLKPRQQILANIIDEVQARRARILRKTGWWVLAGTGVSFAGCWLGRVDLWGTMQQWTTVLTWPVGNLLLLTLLAGLVYGLAVLVQLGPCFRTLHRLTRHARHIKWAFIRHKERLLAMERELAERQGELAGLREENRLLGSSLFVLGQQFHDLAEISGDIFWSLTVEGRIRFVSRTVTQIFGYKPDEVLHKPVMDFIAHDGQFTQHEQEALTNLMNGQAVKISCLRTAIRAKNGTSTPCTLHALSITDEHGNITGFSGVLILAEKQHLQLVQENLFKHLGQGEHSFLPTLATLDDIAIDHLRKVTGETENAAITLATRVQELDDQVSSMLEYLVSSNEWTRNLGSNSQKQIEDDRHAIQDLQAFIAGMKEQRTAELARAQQVIEKIDNLSRLVHLVHEISQRTNVLAMNAHIIAARAGSQGAQFSVVATEVRKLSGQVQQAANEIGDGITHATEHIRNLFEVNENKSQEHTNKEQQFLDHTARQMLKMGENYAKLLDFNENTLHRIHAWNQELAQRVMNLHSGIQFQDITRQQIEQVIRVCERRKKSVLALQATILAQDPAMPLATLNVDDLLDEYVMEGQRNIHFAKTGKDKSPAISTVPDIEFF